MTDPDHPPPDRLETPRLLLCRSCQEDAVELRSALDHSDEHLRPWIPFMRSEPRSLAGTREMLTACDVAFETGTSFRYSLRRRATNALVGETMLIDRNDDPGTLEVGYWLDERHCGHGFATEGTSAVLPLAFDVLNATRLILRCDERNHASLRVARRLGATPLTVEEIAETEGTTRLVVLEISTPRTRSTRDS